MTENGKKRGRPTGSGKDDSALLNAVARKLLANPAMKPSAAMKQVIAKNPQPNTTFETLLRRLQVKWKAEGAALMAAARARAEEEARHERDRLAHQHSGGTGIGHLPRSIMQQFEDIQQLVDRITPSTSYLEKYQDMLNPPGMSAIRKVMEDHKRMQEMLNPPGMSAFKKAMEHHQRMQDLIDPPHMRAAREALKRLGQYPY